MASQILKNRVMKYMATYCAAPDNAQPLAVLSANIPAQHVAYVTDKTELSYCRAILELLAEGLLVDNEYADIFVAKVGA